MQSFKYTTTSFSNPPPPIDVTWKLNDINRDAILSSVDYVSSEEEESDFSLMVLGFLSRAIEKAGGVAVIEVDDLVVHCHWNPVISEDFETSYYMVYVSHMLQAGMLKHCDRILENMVYNGDGYALIDIVVLISKMGFNNYVAATSMIYIVDAAPKLVLALAAFIAISVNHGLLNQMSGILERILVLEPDNLMGLQYSAIYWTETDPMKAVLFGEKLISVIGKSGRLPSIYDRAIYGFALKAANMELEAQIQFGIICGGQNVLMTVKQWLSWGFNVLDSRLLEALTEPDKIEKELGVD
jgi:hypothetical protein